jgi:hypothetical protein
MREHVQPVKDSLNLSPPKDSVVPLFAKNRGGGAV